MLTLKAISERLRAAHLEQGGTQADLRQAAGVSQRTLTHVLGGRQDYKVSTLMAVADRLGLELVLVPKGASATVEAGATAEPRVTSRVSAALARVRGNPDEAAE